MRPKSHHGVRCALLSLVGVGGLVTAPANATADRTIIVRNQCRQTIWPGIFQQELPAGVPQPLGGGWELPSGDSTTLRLPEGFSGRIWARKGCQFDGAGHGSCDTGDCFNGLRCSGLVGRAGSSLAEFTLWRPSNPQAFPQDWYDVSYVDGYDFPIEIAASDPTYKSPSCTFDAIADCPPQQRVTNARGVVVQCLSACTRYGTDPSVSPDLQKIYCCLPPFNGEQLCGPAQYPNPPGNLNALFKRACPDSYSYPLDDPTSVWHYPGKSSVAFTITFCPDGIQTTGGDETPPSSIEAESGMMAGATHPARCAACSGRSKVGYIGREPGNFVTLHVTAAADGRRTMRSDYLVNGTRALHYSVNGGAGVALSLSGKSFSTVAPPHVARVRLRAGSNTIRFYNDADYGPDLDRITIQ